VKAALKHHDSGPEDHLRGRVSCDLYHIILQNPGVHAIPGEIFPDWATIPFPMRDFYQINVSSNVHVVSHSRRG
jgi:hypothetical protein